MITMIDEDIACELTDFASQVPGSKFRHPVPCVMGSGPALEIRATTIMQVTL